MPIEKSRLNRNKIKQVLKEEYNINLIEAIPIDRGTSNVFKIITEKGKYILKEFQSKRNEDTVEKEANIICFLSKRGLQVPQYIKTNKDKLYTKNEGRVIILQKYIEGYTLDTFGNDDYAKKIECATILGEIVKELEKYPRLDDENIIENQFSKESMKVGIQKMKNLQDNIKENNKYKEQFKIDLRKKIEISNQMLEKFDFDIIEKMTIMNSHGDYSIQQLIYKDKIGTTVIDFEKAKSLPIVWEIMRSFSYIDQTKMSDGFNLELMVDYFKEFNKYVKLNEYDIKYAPYLYLIQLVRSTYGYEEYNDNYDQEELAQFAFYRTSICKNLYNNLDIISEKLTKEIQIFKTN